MNVYGNHVNTNKKETACAIQHDNYVLVRADGDIEQLTSELRRMAAGPETTLRVVPTRDGVALLPADIWPRKAYLEITTGCNLNCAMCLRHSWKSTGGKMSADTFSKIVQQIKEMPGMTTINLSGYGEPMTHPLFYEFLSEAKMAGLEVEVVTNGTLLGAKDAERLIDLRLDKLVVSVDGISQGASRLLHPGSLAGVKKKVYDLFQLKLARHVTRPELGIEFVATRQNIHELPELEHRAHVLGITSILVTNLIPYTPEVVKDILYERWSTTSSTRGISPWFPCIDLPLMDARSRATEALERLGIIGTHLRRNGIDIAGMGPRCRFVTEGRFAIRWDGMVSPCLSLMHSHTYYFRDKPKRIRSYFLGNVNETPLERIWSSDAYRAFRDRVRRFEFSPCIDCMACELRDDNEEDCTGDVFPRCGECLWAAGLVQCP